MNEQEDLKKQAVKAVIYLQNNDFEERYLARIHHNGKETYARFFNYWNKEGKTIRSTSNINFAYRVIFIADEHKKGETNFNKLCNHALENYPL